MNTPSSNQRERSRASRTKKAHSKNRDAFQTKRPSFSPHSTKLVGVFEVRKTYGIITDEKMQMISIAPHTAGIARKGDLVRYQITGERYGKLQGRVTQIVRLHNERCACEVVSITPEEIRVRLLEGFYTPLLILHTPKEARNALIVHDILLCELSGELLPKGVRYISRISSGNNPLRFADLFLEQQGLETDFSPHTINSIVFPSLKSEYARREDIRHMDIITIDGSDAKDLDDAISIERSDDGWVLGVHIADVSAYVPAQSAIDRCAGDRATSIYLPESVIPMLPEVLSNQDCSLNTDGDKLTLSAWMSYDSLGIFRSIRISETVMKSKWRGDYDQVGISIAQLFPDEKDVPKKEISTAGSLSGAPRELCPLIRDFYLLTQLISQTHNKLGKLEFDTNELKAHSDETGTITFEKRDRHIAHKMIETAMIEANRHIAKWMRENKLLTPSRVHEGPSEEKLEIYMKLESLNTPDSLKKTLKDMPFSRERLSLFLRAIRELPQSDILERKVLSTLSKAYYTSNSHGHFGLALEDYIHFTSPIRRYPDLLAHRIIKEALQNEKSPRESHTKNQKSLEKLLGISSERERRAIDIERSVFDIYKSEYFSSKIGEIYDARITSILPGVLFAEINPGLEVSLSSEYFTPGIDAQSIRIGGGIKQLGESISLEILSVNSILSRVETRYVPIKKKK